MLRQYFKHFLFSKSFLINCQTWRHIINLWQNVLGSFGEWKRISFQPETKNDFSKPTSLSFSLKLFVETSNHKAIHRSQQFLLKASQLANIKTQFPKWHWRYSFFTSKQMLFKISQCIMHQRSDTIKKSSSQLKLDLTFSTMIVGGRG